MNDSPAVISHSKKIRKYLLTTSIILLSLLVLLSSSGYLYVWTSLPTVEGTLQVPGLTQSVQVTRDQNGVPHIQANSLQDLYIAQGFVTAQDRLFQMDLSRRQASGRLSEVVGEKALDRDKFFRTLGLRRAAEASYPTYSNDAKKALEWYAQGVNAYIEEARSNYQFPVEFTFLGYTPEKWSPIDSLTIGKYMAYDLNRHWSGQAFRYYLTRTFSKEKALDLYPSEPQDVPTIISEIQKTDIDIADSLTKALLPSPWNGSNNWVLSGQKTATGKPLLADDPHLSLATPAIWYQTHLHAPKMNVSGVIFAGIPGIILGHNDHIAWGVTNVDPDSQDLYIEKRNPDNPNQFLHNGKWIDAQVINEPIKIKDKSTIPYKVTITRHGPVISEFAKDTQKETVLAMKWTALEPSTELEAVLRLNQATDWNSFKQALTYFHTPTQNFVFASKTGDIGYRANGKIPIRSKGDALLPVPGWTDEYEWKGFVPWEELPTLYNPPEGFISTANNKVIDNNYPYHISHIWAQPYRAKRIREVLQSNQKFTVQDMQKLQMDQKNLQAVEFVPILLSQLPITSLTPTEKEALSLLQSWNYQDDANLGAPLIFHTWMKEIGDVLFEKEIPEAYQKLFENKNYVVDQLIRNAHAGQPGPWIKEKGGLGQVLLLSYQHTIQKIQSQQGDKLQNWKWGSFHRVAFSHPLSSVEPLSYLFNSESPIPMGGSKVTVQAAGYDYETGLVNHGASWRFVASLDDLNKAWHVLGPGQSGNVLSPWYHDQMEAWVNGTYHETKVKNFSGKTVTLQPIK